MDEAAFAETMNNWNACVEAKSDPDFDRTSFANPLNTAPYYAIKVTAGVHHTMGGLKINAATEVLTEDGTAIPGLFAAGEITGGVHGANRLGGNAVADFVVFGRIAAESATGWWGATASSPATQEAWSGKNGCWNGNNRHSIEIAPAQFHVPGQNDSCG